MLDLLLADVSGGMHSGMPSSFHIHSIQISYSNNLFSVTRTQDFQVRDD